MTSFESLWRSASSLEKEGGHGCAAAALERRGEAIQALAIEAEREDLSTDQHAAATPTKVAEYGVRALVHFEKTNTDADDDRAAAVELYTRVLAVAEGWPTSSRCVVVRNLSAALFNSARALYNSGQYIHAANVLDHVCSGWAALLASPDVVGRRDAFAALLSKSELVSRLTVMTTALTKAGADAADRLTTAVRRASVWTCLQVLACQADKAGLDIPPSKPGLSHVPSVLGALLQQSSWVPASVSLPSSAWSLLWGHALGGDTAGGGDRRKSGDSDGDGERDGAGAGWEDQPAGPVAAAITADPTPTDPIPPVDPSQVSARGAVLAHCRMMLSATVGQLWDATGDWRRAAVHLDKANQLAERLGAASAAAAAPLTDAMTKRVDIQRGRGKETRGGADDDCDDERKEEALPTTAGQSLSTHIALLLEKDQCEAALELVTTTDEAVPSTLLAHVYYRSGEKLRGEDKVEEALRTYTEGLEGHADAGTIEEGLLLLGIGRCWFATARYDGSLTSQWTSTTPTVCGCDSIASPPFGHTVPVIKPAKGRRRNQPSSTCAARCFLAAAYARLTPLAAPLVLRELCRELAIVNGPGGHHTANDEVDTAFLTATSVGMTSRHEMLRVLGQRLRHVSDGPARLRQQWPLFSFGPSTHSVWAEACGTLPDQWTVVVLAATSTNSDLLVSRLSTDCTPSSSPSLDAMAATERVDGAGLVRFLESFQSVFDANETQLVGTTHESVSTFTSKQKAAWLKQRRSLNSRLESLLADADVGVLGWRRVLLYGVPTEQVDRDSVASVVDRLTDGVTSTGGTVHRRRCLDVLVSGAAALLSVEELTTALEYCCTVGSGKPASTTRRTSRRGSSRRATSAGAGAGTPAGAEFALSYQAMAEWVLEQSFGFETCARGPVMLVLSEGIAHLPWESLPTLRSHRAGRVPALPFVFARSPSLMGSDSGGRTDTTTATALTAPPTRPVNVRYVVNPEANLARSQATLQPVMDKLEAAETLAAGGHVGSAPDADTLLEEVNAADVYLYCGHNAGDTFLPRETVATAVTGLSAALLMGCSSGRLKREGQYEPHGTCLSYLTAGVQSVVANLWTVTDKDMDKFSTAVVEDWLLAAEAEADDGRPCLWSTVTTSRDVCKLPFIIGAAPVCYGVPPEL